MAVLLAGSGSFALIGAPLWLALEQAPEGALGLPAAVQVLGPGPVTPGSALQATDERGVALEPVSRPRLRGGGGGGGGGGGLESSQAAASSTLAELSGTDESDPRRAVVGARFSFRCPGGGGDGGGAPLAWSAINDGFCDCPGSGYDEPGTSACAGLAERSEPLFFCGRGGQRVHSSRVGDGVCDCCSGRDEAPGARCPDSCAALDRALARRESLVRDARARAQRDPLLARVGRDVSQVSEALLKALLDGALRLRDGEFSYELLRAGAASGAALMRQGSTVVARGPVSWRAGVLHAGGGDHCPSGVARELEVVFECSASPGRLVRVAEPQMCKYLATVASLVGCLLGAAGETD